MLTTSTRLRVRCAWVIYYLLQDVGDIIMMSGRVPGIKRRAEKSAQQPT